MTEEKQRMGTAMPRPSDSSGKVITDHQDADTSERAMIWLKWIEKLAKRLPPLYVATDKERMPSEAWTEWASYIAIDHGIDHHKVKETFAEGRGLTIVGEPGSGKTRLAVLLAAAAATFDSVWPKFLSAGQLRSAAFASFEAADQLLKTYGKGKLLIIDDLGKGAPSNQADELLFQLLENRGNGMRSTIITTQYSQKLLTARFNDEQTAKGVLRRIGPDFNRAIALKPNK